MCGTIVNPVHRMEFEHDVLFSRVIERAIEMEQQKARPFLV